MNKKIFSKLAFLTAAIAIILMAGGCSSSESPDGNGEFQGTWRLAIVDSPDGQRTIIPADQNYIFTFGDNDSMAATGASCNSCGGILRINGDRISVAEIACTEALCDLLGIYAETLLPGARLEIQGHQMTIRRSLINGQQILYLERQ